MGYSISSRPHNIHVEAFELIEQMGWMTPKELAKLTGIRRGTAATWLSKWANRGYLEYIKDRKRRERKRVFGVFGTIEYKATGPLGYYKITGKCKWWGGLIYERDQEYQG